MNIQWSNFDFLRDNSFYLYSLAKDAERNIYVDNDTCLYKLRKIIEHIVKDIYEKENVDNSYNRNLSFNITYLYDKGYIGKLMHNSLQRVREDCNFSVHNNLYDSDTLPNVNEMVRNAIKSTHFVCGLYVKMYAATDINIRNYKDYYYNECKAGYIDDEVHRINYENEFYAATLNLITDGVKDYLLVKNIEYENLSKIDFDFFFKCYMEALSFMIVKNDNMVDDIIKFKKSCMVKLNIEDGNKINEHIARLIYKEIF